jgi:hypothetical protein
MYVLKIALSALGTLKSLLFWMGSKISHFEEGFPSGTKLVVICTSSLSDSSSATIKTDHLRNASTQLLIHATSCCDTAIVTRSSSSSVLSISRWMCLFSSSSSLRSSRCGHRAVFLSGSVSSCHVVQGSWRSPQVFLVRSFFSLSPTMQCCIAIVLRFANAGLDAATASSDLWQLLINFLMILRLRWTLTEAVWRSTKSWIFTLSSVWKPSWESLLDLTSWESSDREFGILLFVVVQ